MKINTWLGFATAFAAFAFAGTANAQTTITAIFGSGNPDNGWSAVTSNNIQVALRGKNRDDGTVPFSAGNIYTFAGGPSLLNPLRSSVNWEFSVNTDADMNLSNGFNPLNFFNYRLWVDIDPTAAQSWVVFNPMLAYNDNAYGKNTTVNGGGQVGTFANFNNNTIAQNSENFAFGPFVGGPNITGIFDLKLAVYNLNDTDFVNALASVSAEVRIGNVLVGPPTAVPEPSTYGIIGALALASFIGFRRLKARSATQF